MVRVVGYFASRYDLNECPVAFNEEVLNLPMDAWLARFGGTASTDMKPGIEAIHLEGARRWRQIAAAAAPAGFRKGPLGVRNAAPRDENATLIGTVYQSGTPSEQSWQMLGHSRERHHDAARSESMKCRNPSRAHERPTNCAQQ